MAISNIQSLIFTFSLAMAAIVNKKKNIQKSKYLFVNSCNIFKIVLACVAWRFWLGALSNKGGRGQRNRDEIGAGATFLVASPLVRPARQNCHATQAKIVLVLLVFKVVGCFRI